MNGGPELVLSAADLIAEHTGRQICGAWSDGPTDLSCDLHNGHGGEHFDRRIGVRFFGCGRAEQEAGK